jgi:flavin-dependent dehydrogenase
VQLGQQADLIVIGGGPAGAAAAIRAARQGANVVVFERLPPLPNSTSILKAPIESTAFG